MTKTVGIDLPLTIACDESASEFYAIAPEGSGQNPLPRYVLLEEHGSLMVVGTGYSARHLAGFCLAMLPFFGSFGILIAWIAPPTPQTRLMLYAIGGIYLLTCAAMAGLIYLSAKLGQREGVRLRYDPERGEVALPAEGQKFSLDEVVRMQVVETVPFEHRKKFTNDELRRGEVQLVTCRGGVRERWLVLSGRQSIHAFEEVLVRLAQRLPVPVLTVRQKAFSADLDIRSYAPRRAQFHLRHLFWLVTAAGVVFGLIAQLGWFWALFLAVFLPVALTIGVQQVRHGRRFQSRRDLAEGAAWIGGALLIVLLALTSALVSQSRQVGYWNFGGRHSFGRGRIIMFIRTCRPRHSIRDSRCPSPTPAPSSELGNRSFIWSVT